MIFSRLWDATDDDGEFAYKYDDEDDDDRGYESGLSRDSCYADDMEDDIYDYMDRPWIWPTFGAPKDCGEGKRPAVTDLELAQFFDHYGKDIPDSELYEMGCAVDVYDAEFGRLFHSATAAEQIWDRLRLFVTARHAKENAPAPFVRDPEIW